MSAEEPSAIRAVALAKTFTGADATVEAVRGVDLDVRRGEIFGFLGPNGAGKSTTVRMLTTLTTITSGSASVAGVDVAADPDGVRHRIGVALQEAGLDPRQTGRELLVLQARLFGMSSQEAAVRAQELLELVELTDAADRRIKGYSGGMKRRLDLASALVHQPDVLFLDEPTTGLDPASRLDRVGRSAARQRERHDGVPHDAVPRGSRPAVRPDCDHRRRDHRSRRNAVGAQERAPATAGSRRGPDPRRCLHGRDRSQPGARRW